MTQLELPAYILAGGQSRRFGRDKALVEVQGQPLLLKLRAELELAGHRPVHVVARELTRYAHLGVECLKDAYSEAGPVAGLVTALRHRAEQYGAGWLLLTSCDLVGWYSQWSDALRTGASGVPSAACAAETPGTSITAVSIAAGRFDKAASRLQPLPALFHTSLADQAAAIASMQGALRDVFAHATPAVAVSEKPPSDWTFNTVAELDQILDPK